VLIISLETINESIAHDLDRGFPCSKFLMFLFARSIVTPKDISNHTPSLTPRTELHFIFLLHI